MKKKPLQQQPDVNIEVILTSVNGIEQMLGKAEILGCDHENYEILYCEISDDIASIKPQMKALLWSKINQDLPSRYDRCRERFISLEKPRHCRITAENRHLRSRPHITDVSGYYKTYTS